MYPSHFTEFKLSGRHHFFFEVLPEVLPLSKCNLMFLFRAPLALYAHTSDIMLITLDYKIWFLFVFSLNSKYLGKRAMFYLLLFLQSLGT